MLQLKWLEPHHEDAFWMFLVVCLATASSSGFAGYQRCARKEVGTFRRKWHALAISWLRYVGGCVGLGACHYDVLTPDGKADSDAVRKRMSLQVQIFRFFDGQFVLSVFRVFSLQLGFFQCLQILMPEL